MFQQSNFYTSPILANLPPQMIPVQKKDQDWREQCMDALEAVARNQLVQNLKLIENYEMVKGKFIPNHYFGEPEYADMIGQLTREFELPSYLRHYDIISQVVNTLSGEWQAMPDTFRVRAYDEEAQNEYLRQKTSLLQDYVMSKIKAEVAQKMLAQGLDPARQNFSSPEEAQQYQQMIQEAEQKLTPPQIQEYMDTKWTTAAELWGEHQLKLDKQRFRLDEKEKVEFEDMVIASRCYRHYYLTPTGYEQETWNPVTVFRHAAPEVEEVENGDYAGRAMYLTIPAIIDRYGHKMRAEDLSNLEEYNKKLKDEWPGEAAGTGYVYQNYMVPFRDYPTYDIIRQTQGSLTQESGVPYLDGNFFSSLYSGKYFNESRGYFFVVEGYWKSQRKVGKLCYIDPETGLKTKQVVDENTYIPKGIKELDSTLYEDTEEPNTIIWTWVNQVWKGVKIHTKKHGGFTCDLYIDVNPCEFQFRGDINPYGAKLPVCGQVFSARNAQPMSIVDMMKPHQIGYNVAMNQAYAEMQKDYGKFLVMDVNLFADMKDWGGSSAYEKFMLIAKELGVAPIDTSPGNVKGAHAASGGQYPKEIDLDASARILNRLKIAEAFEGFALKQVGFNEYRLGQQAGTTTASTTQQGEQRSFAQTRSLFTQFSNYLRRCYRMNLDIAQYVQSQEKDLTVMYTKSDLSRAFIKLSGTDLLLSDLHVYVSNSQEQVRQVDMLHQLAMSNNTMGATFYDLAQVLSSNSPAYIMQKLKEAQDRNMEMAQQQSQFEQQKLEQEAQAKQAELAQKAEQFEEEWGEGGTRERIAYMQTFSRQQDNLEDTDGSGVPDILEYDKLSQKSQSDAGKIAVQKEKNQLQREKQAQDAEHNQRQLAFNEKKLKNDLQIENKKQEIVRIMKNKEAKKPKPKPKK